MTEAEYRTVLISLIHDERIYISLENDGGLPTEVDRKVIDAEFSFERENP